MCLAVLQNPEARSLSHESFFYRLALLDREQAVVTIGAKLVKVVGGGVPTNVQRTDTRMAWVLKSPKQASSRLRGALSLVPVSRHIVFINPYIHSFLTVAILIPPHFP